MELRRPTQSAAAVFAIALFLLATPAAAQESRVYAGASGGFVTQPHGADEPLGGTGFSASVVAGVWLTPRVAFEVEPAFGPTFSSGYSYRPAPSLLANVVTSRRDTSVAFQLRARLGKVQPVFGAGLAHGHVARHATFENGSTYYDDEASNNGIAVIAGLDAPFHIAPHVSIVPMVRLVGVTRLDTDEPIGSQTGTGAVSIRYGVGVIFNF